MSKHAKLGLRKAIQNIIDTELRPNADVADCPELTDEQVAEVAAIREAKRIPIWFDKRVTTREAEQKEGFRFQWDDEAKDFVRTAIPVPVPTKITAWQAKAALQLTPHPSGGTMLQAAEAALNAMPDSPEKVVVLAAWNNNAIFERTSPTILSFGVALGMTSDDLDDLFRLGGGLTV